MRTHRIPRTAGGSRRSVERELTSRLLVATMFIPLVEALFGWRVHTPFDVPLAVHASILGAVILLTLRPSTAEPLDARVRRAALWLPVPLLAIVFAVVLNARSNAFYTGTALMEGMGVLSAIHFVGCRLRRRALARSGLTLVDSVPTHRNHFRGWWKDRGSPMGNVVTPSVRLADALSTIVGWSLLVAWILIALAHRHVVGPLLIFTGALASLALIVLIPDALLLSGRRVWARVTRRAERTPPDRPIIVRGGARSHLRYVVPHLRRNRS